MKFSNRQVVRLLREIATAYEVRGEDEFRVRAYDKAADGVEHATSEVKDLWEDGRLQEIPGIGASISQHLDEYFRTGKVKHFRQEKRGLPGAMFALIDIPGIGAKTAYKLAKELKISGKTPTEVVGDLKAKAEAGKVRELEGFKEKSEEEILKGISEWEKKSGRMPLSVAFHIAEKVLTVIQKHPLVKRTDPLGSLRRKRSTVGDIDIAVASSNPQEVIKYFIDLPQVERVLAAGEKLGYVVWSGGREINVRAQNEESYGALLQHFTGSKAHNIHLRKVANEMGYSLSEYGIKRIERRTSPKAEKGPDPYAADKIRKFATEEAFYEFLGMAWIPPELREDTGEIEAAQKHALPKLVEEKDVKGDLQLHTTWSDGELSVEELVLEARNLGRKYIGITDHQPSIRTQGLEKVRSLLEERREEILAVDKKYKDIKVLNATEVDIYADKNLALPDELLATFDYVIASIHTSFRQSKEDITERLLLALKNPYVKILGHPTGRLLGEREGYEADWEEIFKFCAKNGNFLEINAFPSRLDLPDDLVREAKGLGVKFTLGTDAHRKEQLSLLPFGVSVARRGWCERGDILNTLSFSELARKLNIERR